MNNQKNLLIAVLSFCMAAWMLPAHAQNNDHMFPAADEAKKYIDFDKQGFIINGKKEFIVSAGLEYARIPRQLWRDRLLRLKRDGFNSVEIYTFWDYHEPAEGKFDFSGDHDLNAFLKLVKEMGMYTIARVGPYYCAEWDFGGYPIWLRFKEGMLLRQPNKPFQDAVSNFFDKLLPIVANNQINKGGSVILVQLENEHPEGKGTNMPNSYFTFLQKKALDLGIKVPYFFSEVHHGSDPAGWRDQPFDSDTRPNPWMSTEFWSVWYNYYGSSQADADTYGRRTWKLIRDGAGGYNYYMAHGGSNFGYTNDNEDAASYDYGAAVGQTGDLRPIYYQFKRNALFARSFQSILSNAKKAPSGFGDIVADTAIKINARHSDNGDVVFLDNPGKTAVDTKLTIDGQQAIAGTLQIAPGEIMPVVKNYQLWPGLTLNWSAVRVLGINTSGNTKTMVIYGSAGSAAALKLSAQSGTLNILQGKDAFIVNGVSAVLHPVFDAQKPTVYSISTGNGTLLIIALNTLLADRTWFVNDNKQEYIITGPEYVGEVTAKNDTLNINTEHFWEQTTKLPVWVFDEKGEKLLHPASMSQNVTHPESIAFNKPWEFLDAGAPAAVNFDDSQYLKSTDATQMGADGDLSCYAWYRTKMNVAKAGDYVLKVREGGDKFMVYVDGVKSATIDKRNERAIPLTAGQHTLAIFTSHAGRDKFFNHIGEAFHKDAKGLSGEIYLQSGKATYLNDWKNLPITTKRDAGALIPAFDDAKPYKVGDDIFEKRMGYVWFQTEIPLKNGAAPKAIFCTGLNDAMALYINGKKVLTKTKTEPFYLDLKELFKPGEKNTLTIFIDHDRPYYKGGITQNVEAIYTDPNDIYLTNWAMKGGPDNDQAVNGWQPLSASVINKPQFFKNEFTIADPASASHAMWRITYDGLSRGSVWVNGHNLGRYPEKIKISSLYIPECWLLKGKNTVVIFDEEGNQPQKVSIIAEKVASRDVESLVFK